MFSKFAEFWIKNSKLTFVFILLIIWAGAFSWLTLPKQYNPDIVVPAFQVTVPAPGYSSQEIQELIVKPLENKLSEIQGVEYVYGYSSKDVGSVMVSFFVGVDKEKATTRIYNKIMSNMDIKPLGVADPIIKPLDPDDIPIYTVAITAPSTELSSWLDNGDHMVQLRVIAQELSDQLKMIEGTSVFYLVGGAKNNINIKVDLAALEAKHVDIFQIYQTLENNNINFPWGSFKVEQHLGSISIVWSLDTIQKVKKLVITHHKNNPVYIEDVAHVDQWISQDTSSTYYANWKETYDAITLGIAKKKGVNAVTVVSNIQEYLSKVKQNLPDGFQIYEIQNEGTTAKKATNMLLSNLIQSIVIVLVILTIFLGYRNAVNISISIPLTLSVVFLYAKIVGDNVNRITLFALILVLGMLVDDATVVVENVNRHLDLRVKTGKTKLDAIFDAIKEVEVGVVLSTVTRLLAFFAMFFVSGMMGEYMGPIPKYAIVTMITSTIVALSVNPFLSYYFSKAPQVSLEKKEQEKPVPSKFRMRYERFLFRFLEKHHKTKRRVFKLFFWIVLFGVVGIPPYMYIFKGRMLPKSDQEQLYLRVDVPRSMSINGTREVAKDIEWFLENYYVDSESSYQDESQIIKWSSYRIGHPPMSDFSNLFRGAGARQWENYLSMRINLSPPQKRSLSSEQFVIKFRPLLKDFLLTRHPNVKIRLLADPPGPPVRATFMLEVSGQPGTDYEEVEELTTWIQSKVYPLLQKHDVVDIENSQEHYQTNYDITINHELVSRLWLTTEQIAKGVYTIFQGSFINLYHDQHAKEPVNIFLGVQDDQKYDVNALSYISFTNNVGKKVALSEVTEIVPTQSDLVRYSDERRPTSYIYGEMWNNSVVYPVVDLIKTMNTSEFWEGKYTVLKNNLYGYTVQDTLTKENYEVMFWGERELTMDTFKDMGTAMIIAFLAIYFMMVAQFKSFKLGGVVMISFLLWFFGVFPGFTVLYLLNNEYFSATSMIGVIALAGIVVGNAILLVEYISILLKRGITLKMAIINAGYTRMKPIFITSLTTILGATTILGDPVRSGLAWSIITGLISSALLTIFVLPIFLYDALDEWQE